MLYQLDHKVLSFEPDVVLFLGHVSDMERTSRQLMKMVRRGTLPPEPFLVELLERTGIESGTGANEARRRLKGHERAVLLWVYRQFIQRCRDNGAVPVFVYMEAVTDLDEVWRAADRQEVLAVAREAGLPILDLTGAYGSHPSSALWIAENDGHPNAFGNQLVAQRLYDLLQQRGQEFGLPLASTARPPGQ
jgi:lysophospholipase L1-like esterase